MKCIMINSIILFSIVICIGCSQDNQILSSSGQGLYYPLRTEYYRMYGDEKIIHETSSELLSLRFNPSLSSSEIDNILHKYDLTLIRSGDYKYKLYIVQTDDAFATASLLLRDEHFSREARKVEYVGPVFIWSTCNDKPLYTYPTNWIAVNGTVEDRGVRALLQTSDATLIEVLEFFTLKVYYYELPWGDAGELFDLANRLHFHPSIEWAEPNMLVDVCWDNNSQTTAANHQEWLSNKPLKLTGGRHSPCKARVAPPSRSLAPNRWRGRFAPRHRCCGLPSAFCPALRAGHQADAAGDRPREQARASARR